MEYSKRCWLLPVNCLKFGANIKEIGWLKKENILVDHKRHQSARMENSKQYSLKRENVQQNKWVERKVNVCDRTVRK